MKFLQKIRARSVERAYKDFLSLCSYQPKNAILDIGIGNGIIALHLRTVFDINIVGTDILDYVSMDNHNEIPFVKMEKTDKVPFPDKSFTYAMLNDVLHHVPQEEQIFLIREGVRVSTGGGCLSGRQNPRGSHM